MEPGYCQHQDTCDGAIASTGCHHVTGTRLLPGSIMVGMVEPETPVLLVARDR